MKTISSLLITLGLVSLPALAQVHSTPQPAAEAGSSGASSASGSGDASSGASSPVLAEPGAALPPEPSPTARLKPVTQDDVTYLCGGVGEEESRFMKAQARDYDLMLTFATRSGAYLADVDVDISDARGNNVLQLACDSPILLVDLPKGGTYKVRAEAAGYTLNKTVRVAGSAPQSRVASSILSWPQQVAEAGGPPTSTGSGSGGEAAAGSGAR
ncbi:hypothetical protein [Noviherbaspirillum sp.]|uniref:hypothetical protein n=1 Tax=Noviherbaspirillum sp. TaxID=1926288 RepID=UPI002D468411|nr:hypothetical protein [Noviherbaspirillum sp.]HZW21481.1 hypothetical protein [Noviherbaspirillum sp.]